MLDLEFDIPLGKFACERLIPDVELEARVVGLNRLAVPDAADQFVVGLILFDPWMIAVPEIDFFFCSNGLG